VLAHNPPDGPWAVGLAFHAALTHDDGPQLDVLRNMVTRESLAAWGDRGPGQPGIAGGQLGERCFLGVDVRVVLAGVAA